jgi:hypothetical protein
MDFTFVDFLINSQVTLAKNIRSINIFEEKNNTPQIQPNFGI